MDRDEAERRARAMVDAARRTREPPPRWVWVVSLAVGAVCIAALVVGWLAYTAAPARDPHAQAVAPRLANGGGFAAGVVTGLVAGVVLGHVLARHSWRKRPYTSTS